MTLIAPPMSVVLLLLALLHGYWGLGGVWPARDGRSLARTVAGFAGIERMPPAAASLAVAVALLAACLWPLMLAAEVGGGLPDWLVGLGGLGLAFVFTVRGILGYLPGWRRRTPEQPFARLDPLLYSPLCLLLGSGFFALLLEKLTP